MKTLQNIIALAVVFITFSAPVAQAGEVTEWLKAAAFVYLKHEVGHAERADKNSPGLDWTYRGGLIPDYNVSYLSKLPLKKEFSSAFESLKSINSVIQPGMTVSDELVKYMNNLAGEAMTDFQKITAENAVIKQQNLLIERRNKRTSASVAGGGFDAQQEAVEELPNGEFKRKALILSAALKGGYVPYHYLYCGALGKEYTGDIVKMSAVAPVSLISSALLVSAATDFYRTTQDVIPSWHIDFLSNPQTGAVGLAVAGTF